MNLSANRLCLLAGKLSLTGDYACTACLLLYKVCRYSAGKRVPKFDGGGWSCRCNFDEMQRATWVRIAHEGSHRGPVFVMGLHLDLPLGLCIQRAETRAEHPTLNGSNVADVIHRLNVALSHTFICGACDYLGPQHISHAHSGRMPGQSFACYIALHRSTTLYGFIFTFHVSHRTQ